MAECQGQGPHAADVSSETRHGGSVRGRALGSQFAICVGRVQLGLPARYEGCMRHDFPDQALY